MIYWSSCLYYSFHQYTHSNTFGQLLRRDRRRAYQISDDTKLEVINNAQDDRIKMRQVGMKITFNRDNCKIRLKKKVAQFQYGKIGLTPVYRKNLSGFNWLLG